MRHQLQHRKLNRPTKQRKVLLTSLAQSLLRHERIQTTLPKAKTLRPVVERLITLSKKKTLHTRRRLAAALPDQDVQKKLYNELGQRFEKRAGGYTRIIKMGKRFGDNADVALIELVDKASAATAPAKGKTAAQGAKKAKAASKAAPKADVKEASKVATAKASSKEADKKAADQKAAEKKS
ncbi:MAG: 50S ribosomal protein L17 [Holosporaceae bacterium]